MSPHPRLEARWRQALAHVHQARLIALIGRLLENAIDRRAPRKRPPGKAGLRAEKGYYRLLYLQDEFTSAVAGGDQAPSPDAALVWNRLQTILDQLTDIPELQAELMAGIEGVLDAVSTDPPSDR